AGHGQENDGRRESQFTENAGTLEAHGGSAGVVIGARRIPLFVEGVAVARVVMPGHEGDVFRPPRIGAPYDRVNIGDLGRLRNAVSRRLGECVGFYLETASTFLGIALEFRANPFARCANPPTRYDRSRILR